MDLVILGLWWLALARATRLLTKDMVTDFIRIWAHRRTKGADTALTYFVSCPWCVGLWLALGSTWYVILLAEWSWWLYPVLAGAGSYLVGLMAENFEDDEDAEIVISD